MPDDNEHMAFEVQYINEETGREHGRLFTTKQAADEFINRRGIKDHQLMYYGWTTCD